MDDYPQHLAFDFGSYMTRVGFSGDDAPRSVFPTVVGRPKYHPTMVGLRRRDTLIGDEAMTLRGELKLSYPIQGSTIVNYDDWERTVHHGFYNELRVAPEEHAIVFNVPAFAPRAQGHKMCQTLFETFAVPAIAGFNSQLLTSYSRGPGTCLAVELGHGSTQIGAFYEGSYISESAYQGTVAGAALNEYATRLLMEQVGKRGLSIAGLKHQVDDLKCKLCYVAENYEAELDIYVTSNAKEMQYELSDGKVVQFGAERIRIPEVLFKPSLIGSEELPLSHLIYRSIMKAPMDVRADLYSNICLFGGSSFFPGLTERLQAEIVKLAPATAKVRIIAPPERKFSVWIGASIISSLSSAMDIFFSKEQYDEIGPNGFHKFGIIPVDESLKTKK